MIEHDLMNNQDLNICVKYDDCNGFDGLCHDGPMFERSDCVNDIMINTSVLAESVSVWDRARKVFCHECLTIDLVFTLTLHLVLIYSD